MTEQKIDKETEVDQEKLPKGISPDFHEILRKMKEYRKALNGLKDASAIEAIEGAMFWSALSFAMEKYDETLKGLKDR